jgi:hypothetical protein
VNASPEVAERTLKPRWNGSPMPRFGYYSLVIGVYGCLLMPMVTPFFFSVKSAYCCLDRYHVL